ncbi:MAG: ankyrin repeat domain-containing protein [Leptospiraceae bacterium]|nr:ankyrin repeat domain-containing protein [Leptospiraceae bacterium]
MLLGFLQGLSADSFRSMKNCIFNSNISCLKLFSKKKGLLKKTDVNGWSGLHWAVHARKEKIVEFLLENGLKPESGEAGTSPLHLAAWNGNLNISRLLLDAGAEIDNQDKYGDTPLMSAAIGGHFKLLELLIQKKADVNRQNKQGKTALIRAVEFEQIEIAKLLLDNQAKLSLLDGEGKSAMLYAVESGNKEMIRLLNRYGANNPYKALYSCIKANNLPCFQKSLISEDMLSYRENGKDSLLKIAIAEGSTNIINFILQHELSDSLFSDKEGSEMLLLASRLGDIKLVQKLLDKGASLHYSNAKGENALYIACQHKHTQLVSLYLNLGIDYDSHNSHSKSCSSLMKNKEYEDIAKLIQKHIDKERMEEAIEKEDMSFIKVHILDWKNSTVFCGNETLLGCAILKKKYLVMEYLAEDKDLQNKTNLRNKSPLFLAAEEGDEKAISILVRNNIQIKENSFLKVFFENASATSIEALLKDENLSPYLKPLMNRLFLYVLEHKLGDSVYQSFLSSSFLETYTETNEDGKTLLHLSLENGNKELVETLIRREPKLLEMPDLEGRLPLHYASLRGEEMLRLLSSGYSNLDIQDKYGYTPLQLALLQGEYDSCFYLLEKGASPYITNKEGDNLFSLIYQQKDIPKAFLQKILSFHQEYEKEEVDKKMWMFLYARAANFEGFVKHFSTDILNERDPSSMTILMRAASVSDNGKIVKFLLDAGAEKEERNYSDRENTALLYALLNKADASAIELIKRGAFYFRSNRAGMTPLQAAILYSGDEVIDLLIEKGVDINYLSLYGSPLHVAVKRGSKNLVKRLLEKEANPDRRDSEGFTPLMLAAKLGKEEILQLLLSKGASRERLNPFTGMSALHYACLNGHEKTVALLIEKGSSVNRQVPGNHSKYSGYTPLHFASISGNVKTVQHLLNSGVLPFEEDAEGNTALHIAASGHDPVILKLLLKRFSSFQRYPSPENKHKQTPLMFASENSLSFVRLLLDYGASIREEDEQGRTALFYALESNKEDIAKYLVLKGSEIQVEDIYRNTPLLIAVKHSNFEIARLLIDNKADANIQSRDNWGISNRWTPLMWAVHNKKRDLVKLLLHAGARVKTRDASGKNALQLATEVGADSGIMSLLEVYSKKQRN